MTVRLRYWHLRFRLHRLSHRYRVGNYCIRCGAPLRSVHPNVYPANTTDKASPAQD